MPPLVVFKTGNIVDEPTDGLVCSGNVQLNMSGGVNGELLGRGGINLQRQLHAWLQAQSKRFVEPGFVMRIGPAPFRFKSMVYTVAIDAWYDSSVELVAASLTSALELLQQDGCRSVSIPALATGYGHLSKPDFGKALQSCLDGRPWIFDEVRVVLKDEWDLAAVRNGYVAGPPLT